MQFSDANHTCLRSFLAQYKQSPFTPTCLDVSPVDHNPTNWCCNESRVEAAMILCALFDHQEVARPAELKDI